MHVFNVHERIFDLAPERVGALIDTLASPKDLLWPNDLWPRMAFDRSLTVGAAGGHGPIRYRIEAYRPARSIRFRFLVPSGFDGFHAFDVIEEYSAGTFLRHTLAMNTRGLALFSWPVVFRPLHDALIEDSMARAEASLGREPKVVKWSLWVRLLRWAFSAGKAGPQRAPDKSPDKKPVDGQLKGSA